MRDDRGLGVNVCVEVTVLNVSQSTKTCLKLIWVEGRKSEEDGEKSREGQLRWVGSSLLPSAAQARAFCEEFLSFRTTKRRQTKDNGSIRGSVGLMHPSYVQFATFADQQLYFPLLK